MDALVEINAVFCKETFHELVVVCAESTFTIGFSELSLTPGAVTLTEIAWMLLSSRISSTKSSGSILNSIRDSPESVGVQVQNKSFIPPGPKNTDWVSIVTSSTTKLTSRLSTFTLPAF